MALPTPTALTPTQRYYVAGTRRYSWVPTITDKNSPSLSELSAGTDLTTEVNTLAGFNKTANMFEVPDAGTLFTSKIPGRISSDDSSITFYLSKTSTDVRQLLTQGLAGFIVIYWEGIVTGGKMGVFPTTVTAPSKNPDLEAAGMIEVGVAITSEPVMDVDIPAA